MTKVEQVREIEQLRYALKQALVLLEADAKIDAFNGKHSPSAQFVIALGRKLIPSGT
jgi:hypothetical protein